MTEARLIVMNLYVNLCREYRFGLCIQLFFLVLCSIGLSSCLTYNSHQSVLELSRVYPAYLVYPPQHVQEVDGKFYVEAYPVECRGTCRTQWGGIIDEGFFASDLHHQFRLYSKGCPIYLRISPRMKRLLCHTRDTVYPDEIVLDWDWKAGGEIRTSLPAQANSHAVRCIMKAQGTNRGRYLAGHEEAILTFYRQPVGQRTTSAALWTYPGAVLAAVAVDVPVTLVANVAMIVSFPFWMGNLP